MLYYYYTLPPFGTQGVEGYAKAVELTFFYALVWSIGATVDEDSRKCVILF